jgi:primosomal protein N' (replication factor Y)
MIRIDIKHKDFHNLNFIADRLAAELRKVFAERVIGPEFPLVGRIRNYYIKTIILKNERTGTSMHKIKEALLNILQKVGTDKDNKGVYIQIDVDPF